MLAPVLLAAAPILLSVQDSVGLPNETWKLLAGSPNRSDAFGSSVALGRNYLVVGARGDDPYGGIEDSGSATVFRRTGDQWILEQQLIASDPKPSAFGDQVAIDGRTIVVGAWADQNKGGVGAGAVYVFTRNERDWSQTAKLIASDGSGGDVFGTRVDLDGNTLVVGAPGADLAGAAYVFELVGSCWVEVQKLIGSDSEAGDTFGSVCIDNDTIVVGASHDTLSSGVQSGSVYVFERSEAGWIETSKLVAPIPMHGEGFGAALGLFQDTLVVGAPFSFVKPSGVSSCLGQGAAYVFVRESGSWHSQRKLIAESPACLETFGAGVAIEDDTILISVPGDSDQAPGAGSGHVFRRSNGTWSRQSVIFASDAAKFDGLGGNGAALSGGTAALGSPRDNNAGGVDAGSAYVFELE